MTEIKEKDDKKISQEENKDTKPKAEEKKEEKTEKKPVEKRDNQISEKPARTSYTKGDGKRDDSRPSGRFQSRHQGGGGRFRSKNMPFFKKKVCRFCTGQYQSIEYKDIDMLRKFVTDRGKILPRRITGTCAKHQRRLSTAIKRARIIALLPFVSN